jgi:hypothetical protein
MAVHVVEEVEAPAAHVAGVRLYHHPNQERPDQFRNMLFTSTFLNIHLDLNMINGKRSSTNMFSSKNNVWTNKPNRAFQQFLCTLTNLNASDKVT